jgi:hypothetical protein
LVSAQLVSKSVRFVFNYFPAVWFISNKFQR